MAIVSGTYEGPDGWPAQGSVRFRLLPAAVDVDGVQRTSGPVEVPLSPMGAFSVDLVPDPELVVDGEAVYEVYEQVTGLQRAPWHLLLSDDQPVDLPSRWPGDVQGPVAIRPAGSPEYEQCPTWADLPGSGNYVGRKFHVLDGIGFCVALWNGTAWVVAPESDTGWQPLVPYLINGWETGSPPTTMMRRQGNHVVLGTYTINGPAATANTCLILPDGFGYGPHNGFPLLTFGYLPIISLNTEGKHFAIGIAFGQVQVTALPWGPAHPYPDQLLTNCEYQCFEDWPTSLAMREATP